MPCEGYRSICEKGRAGVIGKLKGYLSYLIDNSYSKHYEWHVAIRKRSDSLLFEGNAAAFLSVPNDGRYWRADPFLFSYKGEDYLFVEMYDRWKEKGVIGVSRIRDGKCGRFRVCLELPWHLSYPCIIEEEGNIYMIPECSASGELWMYRCVRFPYRWEKAVCIAKEAVADATPLTVDGKRYWFGTVLDARNVCKNDNLAICKEGSNAVFTALYRDQQTVRPAGHFIQTRNGWVRPAQNCSKTYGGNLIFYQIDCLDMEQYSERAFCSAGAWAEEMEGKDIRIQCQPTIGTSYAGVHTYNCNDRYEVIDFKYHGAHGFITMLKNLRERKKHKG